jgi:hypothetical protein
VWLSNGGLAALMIGFLLRPYVGTATTPVVATGGTIAAVGAYLFVYTMWRIMDGRAAIQASLARSAPGQPPLRVERHVNISADR